MLMTSVLVAREHEVRRAMHALQFSGGVAVFGEAGVGKTALAAATAAQLKTPPVAGIVATAASRATPLAALAGLLPADLATIHPALVASHVAARLADLSRAGGRSLAPPVLVVDDAHLLDSQSAAVLLSLVTAKSLRLLITLRVGTAPSDAVTALWKEGLVERLDLGPLDRRASRELLETLLGGPVASGTLEMLWTSSHGNPFYLTQLARFAVDRGQLELNAGVWWWVGATAVPPRLGELLQSRLRALSPPAQDAVELLALGETLPYETLAALVDEQAILELDRAEIVASDESDGVLRLRFMHPILHTVAEHRLTGTRRRALARRLAAAPADHVDLVRRATWEDASGNPNADLLLAAADAVLLHDSDAAVRLAGRAHAVRADVASAARLAAAQSETGRPVLARQTLAAAAEAVRTDEERYQLAVADFSLSLWGERDPQRARTVLEWARAELPDRFRADLLGAEAVHRLFTAGCGDVLPLAEAALAAAPSPSAEIRALTCLTGALTFADRGPEAIEAGRRLLDALAGTRVEATRTGLAYALVAVTGLIHGVSYTLPRSRGTSGRWPDAPQRLGTSVSPYPFEGERPEESGVGWPLLVGVRRHLRGDLEGALAPLREAYVQQQVGEGPFRSEATAQLIVVLAQLGHAEEAAAILADHPPDAVAIIPGLADWSRAGVAAARGQRAEAQAAATRAARSAAARGAGAMAMNFLTDAARWGDPRAAAAVLPELGLPLDTAVQRARATDLRARATRNPAVLLAAAEAQLAAGFVRHALELAALARAIGRAGVERPVAAVERLARDRLGQAGREASPLTAREAEVARLAGAGLSDREIADQLVLSIRTVQSHLAATYRKLGIGSRAELGAVDR